MSTNAATLALASLTAAVGRIGDDVRQTAAAIIAHINGEAGISAGVLNDLAARLNASADALEQVKLDGAAQAPAAPDAGDDSGLDTSGGTTTTGTDVGASPEPGNADGASSSDGASDGASDGSDSSGSGSDIETRGSGDGLGADTSDAAAPDADSAPVI